MQIIKRKGFAHIILLVIIVLVGIVGLIYFAYKNGQVKITSQQNNTPTSLTPTVSKVDTLGWKTYTNTEYDFSLKYPSSFLLKSNNEINTQGQIIQITNTENYCDSQTKLVLNLFVTKNEPFSLGATNKDLLQLNKIGFNDLKTKFGSQVYGTFLNNSDSNGCNPEYIFGVKIPRNKGQSYLFEVQIPVNQKEDSYATVKNILNSLQQTTSNETKVYTNTSQNFSLVYPNTWYYTETYDNRIDFRLANCADNCPAIIIQIFDNPNNYSPADWWTNSIWAGPGSAEKIKRTVQVENNTAYQVRSLGDTKYNVDPNTLTVFTKNKKAYEIVATFGSEKPEFDSYESIIQSFKFIN